ncbi:MAG TPA: FYDLN acid domain-containing protein [Thermoanaerobaculia bacterium]|nr:FYDLN acid domain-containing protein [Thermoanaerobaculia bacterium]
MPDLGKKYTCYSCHTKFYDLGKPVPLCPKCGADQRDADEAPVYTAPRSRRVVVEEPPEEEEFTPAASPGEASEEEGEDFAPAEDEREEDAEEEEEY